MARRLPDVAQTLDSSLILHGVNARAIANALVTHSVTIGPPPERIETIVPPVIDAYAENESGEIFIYGRIDSDNPIAERARLRVALMKAGALPNQIADIVRKP